MKRINRDTLFVLFLFAAFTLTIGAVVIWRLNILREPLIILAGSRGNPYYNLSQRYQKFLAEKHIKVGVCETAGSPQILDMLAGLIPANTNDIKCTTLDKHKDSGGHYKTNDTTLHELLSRKFRIVAGFMQGGVQALRLEADRRNDTNEAKSAGDKLYSMGRVITEPLWVYYTCDGKNVLHSLGELQGRNLYIGTSASGTNLLSKFLLSAFAIRDNINNSSADLFTNKLSNAASFKVVAADLRDADQKLSPTQDVCLLNITDADAVTQRFPFLKPAVLHKGALNPGKKLPGADVNLVATQAAFLIKRELDVALQNLFAQAVLHVQADLGDEAAYFPIASSALAADDAEFLVSPEALRVYRSEKTFFQRVLPFWIATILDDIIVFLLAMPFFGIMLQLFRMVPVTRDMMMRMRRDRLHRDLDDLYRNIETAASERELLQIEEKCAQIMTKVRKTTLYDAERFNLTHHNRVVKEHLREMRERMKTS